MEGYENFGGDSNIDSYEISDDRILVVFKSGKERNYLYTYNRPGKYHVDMMKKLAIQGEGLNSYINTIVMKNFESKW